MRDFCVSAIATEDLWVSSAFGLGLGSGVGSLNPHELCKHLSEIFITSCGQHSLISLSRHGDLDMDVAWLDMTWLGQGREVCYGWVGLS